MISTQSSASYLGPISHVIIQSGFIWKFFGCGLVLCRLIPSQVYDFPRKGMNWLQAAIHFELKRRPAVDILIVQPGLQEALQEQISDTIDFMAIFISIVESVQFDPHRRLADCVQCKSRGQRNQGSGFIRLGILLQELYNLTTLLPGRILGCYFGCD